MKNKSLGSQSIVNSQIFQKYKEELGKEHDFSELDKEISKKDKIDKQNTNLGRS